MSDSDTNLEPIEPPEDHECVDESEDAPPGTIPKGESAATRARSKEKGTWAGRVGDGSGMYTGELAYNQMHGSGVFQYTGGNQNRDKYAGDFMNGKLNGLGIYEFGDSAKGGNAVRYEGEFRGGSSTGFGSYTWPTATYFGNIVDGRMEGAGVERWSSGMRYEGEYAHRKRNGLGAIWNSDGSVNQAGRWQDNSLIQSMSK